MVHPLFSVLVSRPELVVEHAAGYAALVRDEATGLGTEVLRRGIAWAVAVVLFAAFLVLAGTALMLGALQSQFHWALLAAPAVALGLAVAAWLQARRPLSPAYFAELRSQLDADALALRRAAGHA